MIRVTAKMTRGGRSSIAALAIAAAVMSAPAVQADESAAVELSEESAVTPGQVFALVQHITADLERLRLVMGKPKVGPPIFTIENSRAINVFEFACELLEKTNQRADEFGIGSWVNPPSDNRATSLADVFAVVKTAHRQLGRIGDRMGIIPMKRVFSIDESKTQNDVIEAIIQCNRQLNLLMDRPLDPSEVFSKVSLAVSYLRLMNGERSKLASADRVRFVPHRQPSDVYAKLRETNQLVSQLGRLMGVVTPTMLFAEETAIAPSDVQDLAMLILTNLRRIDGVVMVECNMIDALYYPGPRFPSHVYQRVGTLNVLLEELIAKLDAQELTGVESYP